MKSNFTTATAVVLTALLLVAGGCSRKPATGTVKGRITLDQQPVEGASVMFVPVEGGRSASGLTDAEGYYQLTTFERNDGAIVGKHAVTVVKQKIIGAQATPDGGVGPAPPSGIQVQWLVPERYGKRESSGLKVDVTSGENSIDFDLTSASDTARSR